jgi:hypothetical protein
MPTREEARAFYDAFGAEQDRQAFHEDPRIMDTDLREAFGRAPLDRRPGGHGGRSKGRSCAD